MPKNAAVAAPIRMPNTTTIQNVQSSPNWKRAARTAVRYAPMPRYAACPSEGSPVKPSRMSRLIARMAKIRAWVTRTMR